MGGWIECWSSSRIESMLVHLCARCRYYPLRLKRLSNRKSSLALDGATHIVGLIIPSSRITGNIYEYLSHWNMESTSWLFWWYDPICKFLRNLLINMFFYPKFILIVQIWNVCWTSDVYCQLIAPYLWLICANLIQKIHVKFINYESYIFTENGNERN